jgi:hypothetical protein
MSRSVRFTNDVVIRRTPPDVFEFVADFTRIPTWNHAIRATRQVTPGPVTLGTAFRQVRTLPTEAEEVFEVTTWEPGRRVAITGDFGPFRGTLAYELDPDTSGTLLTNRVDLAPAGLPGLAARLVALRVRAAMAENLDVLRRHLDAGA